LPGYTERDSLGEAVQRRSSRLGDGRPSLFFSLALGGGVMSKLALSYSSQKSRLTTALGAVPLLAPKMGLFKNNIVPTPSNVLADFTEADFTGYAQQSITWGAVGVDQSGIPVGPGTVTFTQTAVTVSEIVYGMFIVDSTGAIVGAALFDTPVNFGAVGAFAVVTVLFGLVAGAVSVATGP
jgi:hypothetical protein